MISTLVLYFGVCCIMVYDMSFSVPEMTMNPMWRQSWSREWWTVSPKILWTMSWQGIDAGTYSLSVSVWLIRFDMVYLNRNSDTKVSIPHFYTFLLWLWFYKRNFNFFWIIQCIFWGKSNRKSQFKKKNLSRFIFLVKETFYQPEFFKLY